MSRLKSLFISSWITLLTVGVARAGFALYQNPAASAWLWVLLGLAPSLLFFVWLLLGNVARSARAPQLMVAIAVIAVLPAALTPGGNAETWAWLLLVGVGGSALYHWWYSVFEKRDNSVLAVGKPLPPLQFDRPDGKLFDTTSLSKPMLMIFYRGNWCPLCMAQIKEVAGLYQQLADRGVEVMLISPQGHENTETLAARFDVPMTFLVDSDNRMAERLGIKAENGLPAGLEALGYDSDTVMPTVVISDAKGTIIYADLTENYRIRPEPDAFLEVFAKAGI